MAYGNPSSDDSMYSDAGDQAPTGETQEKGPQESEQPTALLPKTILAGKEFKPGDEIVLKIVTMHENEVEVQYASEKAEEKGEQGAAPMQPPGGDSEMASMME